ncbi:cell wall hydrolase [Mobilitalea sibirica]|uniref:Cell wall hydrolase n=1 Tax=Mobilitalea sibirica TaxID=1462919 RepID=A0A8J7HCY8_9FIRM|nr:cell wall hydrolase [Mobilitalea sibirica]MBH1940339.1 cell wall hydrolase [Mobilitalea sibirica]
MVIINSFLQKRKMHESRHGFHMVILAYVLSFLLLVFGSDALYNINTGAEGISMNTNEATKMLSGNITTHKESEPQALLLQSKSINPNGMLEVKNNQIYKAQIPIQKQSEDLDATNWVLGYAMDSVEYDMLMDKISDSVAEQTEHKQTDTAEGTIESFSTQNKTQPLYSVTKEELTMLERIVEAEATGEDMIGKILIANVVFNRLHDEEFPKTIKGVIFHKVGGEYQFSPVSDKRYWNISISDETKEAVQRALEGEDYSKGALYFMARKRTRKSSARWFDNNLDWLFKHGGHEFYKNK